MFGTKVSMAKQQLENKNKLYDQHMRALYDDSSEEDLASFSTNNAFNGRIRKRNIRKETHESPLKQTLIKPCLLNVIPTSPKEDFILDEQFKVPGAINQYLRDYQRKGVKFLFRSFKEKCGCILADDMGLGKTIQVIALVSAILNKTGDYNNDKQKMSDSIFLVIAPSSVLYNWIDELNMWGHFKVGKFHRNNKAEVIELAKNGEVEIVLTTYETMRIYLDMLVDITWSMIICDEVHRIKSKDSQLTKACKQLKSKSRVGLTGTPLQNDLVEFWCVLDWANPSCFGTYEKFEQNFARPIYVGQRFKATKRELATARKKQQELSLIHQRWLLRRTKEKILTQLPAKDEKIVFCKLSQIQVSMYQAILELPKVKLLLNMDEECDCGSGLLAKKCCHKNFNWRRWLFPCMQLLLKVSNHAALLLHNTQTDEQKQISRDLCSKLFKKHPNLEELCTKQNILQMSDPDFCGKMTIMRRLLSVHQKKGDKALVFSHSIQLLNILETYLISCGMIYRRLDGSTPIHMRNELVKEFNNDPSIFLCLLSTTAGSLGLNFIGANVVIIFDPMWNPSFDQQAQDRAYRIGQRKNVQVYRLISIGTIEESIYMRQIYKQQLSNIAVEMSKEPRYFNAVPKDKHYRGELYGVANLFKFNPDHTSIFAMDVFEKVKFSENGIDMAKYKHQNDVTKHEEKDENDSIETIDSDDDHCIDPMKYLESQHEDLNPPMKIDNDGDSDDDDSDNDDDDNDDDEVTYANKTIFSKLKEKDKTVENDIVILNKNDGIQYGHSTKLLIGSNKHEEVMSKKAIMDVFWDGRYSQQMANDIGDDNEFSDDTGEVPLNKNESKSTRPISSVSTFERVGNEMFIIGATPPSIKSKQFEEIAKNNGYDNVEGFAQYIINCKPKDRKSILKKYYEVKEKNLSNISCYKQIYMENEDHISKRLDRNRILSNKIKNNKSLKQTCQKNKYLKRKSSSAFDKFSNSFSDSDVKTVKKNKQPQAKKNYNRNVVYKKKLNQNMPLVCKKQLVPTTLKKFSKRTNKSSRKNSCSKLPSKYRLDFSPSSCKTNIQSNISNIASSQNVLIADEENNDHNSDAKHFNGFNLNYSASAYTRNSFISEKKYSKTCESPMKREYTVLSELLDSQNDIPTSSYYIKNDVPTSSCYLKNDIPSSSFVKNDIPSSSCDLETDSATLSCYKKNKNYDLQVKNETLFSKKSSLQESPFKSKIKNLSSKFCVLDSLLNDTQSAQVTRNFKQTQHVNDTQSPQVTRNFKQTQHVNDTQSAQVTRNFKQTQHSDKVYESSVIDELLS